MRTALTNRLRDERGMALVMAIGISFVLAIMGASVVIFSTANEKSSYRVSAGTRAYSIAQAGIDNAAAQLSTANGDPANGAVTLIANPGSGATNNWIRSICATPGSCTKSIDGGTVTWDGWLETNCADGVCGDETNDIYHHVWHLTSTGSVPNPSGAGLITRRVTSDVELAPLPSQTVNASAWKYVYSKKSGATPKPGEPFGCDEYIYNNTTLRSPMYVSGNLCIENSAELIGPTPPSTTPPVAIIVKGKTWLSASSSFIGFDKGPPVTPQPVNHAYLDQGCIFKNGALHSPCGAADQVFTMAAGGLSETYPTTIPGPVAAFEDWYAYASPGPTSPCDPSLVNGAVNAPAFDDRASYPGGDGVKNQSKPTLNLTPSTYDYSCKTQTGELIWTRGSGGNPGQLKVMGTLFWDGDVEVNGIGRVDYTGVGALYLSGSFYMRQSTVCANYATPTSSTCSFTGWDFTNNMLVIVAEGSGAPASAGMSISLDQSTYQGALYAATSIEVATSANAQGPMVAEQEVIKNNSDTQDFPDNLTVPFGTPGNIVYAWKMTPPTNYTG